MRLFLDTASSDSLALMSWPRNPKKAKMLIASCGVRSILSTSALNSSVDLASSRVCPLSCYTCVISLDNLRRSGRFYIELLLLFPQLDRHVKQAFGKVAIFPLDADRFAHQAAPAMLAHAPVELFLEVLVRKPTIWFERERKLDTPWFSMLCVLHFKALNIDAFHATERGDVPWLDSMVNLWWGFIDHCRPKIWDGLNGTGAVEELRSRSYIVSPKTFQLNVCQLLLDPSEGVVHDWGVRIQVE